MKLKKCVKCKKELPMTLEYFFARKQRASGISSWCKECHKEYMVTYRKDNREKLLKQSVKRTGKYVKKHRQYYNNYTNIHEWVRRHKQKPKICCICNERRKLELANISGEYKRDIKDFLYVCKKCHVLFDLTNKTHKR